MVAFGGIEHAKEGVRAERWLAWAPAFTLDLRLGARMLAKAPGLTVVGGLGMAVGVAISAGAFALFHSYFFPDLPLHEGDRVVSIVNIDPRLRSNDLRVLHDFGVWRRELRSVADLGAFRTIPRKPDRGDGRGRADHARRDERGGLRVARIAPRLGRTLHDKTSGVGRRRCSSSGSQSGARGSPAIPRTRSRRGASCGS